MRRLFSTFARGSPGVGLLLLRLIAAAALIHQGQAGLQVGATGTSILLTVLRLSTAVLLAAGLWTPIAGSITLTIEFLGIIVEPGDHWVHLLLAALGAGLALLGPGVWSVDARLFGWKRVGPRKGEQKTLS